MPVTIKLPTPLRRFTDQQKVFSASATTVSEALAQLVERYPEMRGALFAECGALKPFVRVFVGEQDIQALRGTDTQLGDGDTLTIFPPVAGA